MFVYYKEETGEIIGSSNDLLEWDQLCEYIQVETITQDLTQCRINLETHQIEPVNNG